MSLSGNQQALYEAIVKCRMMLHILFKYLIVFHNSLNKHKWNVSLDHVQVEFIFTFDAISFSVLISFIIDQCFIACVDYPTDYLTAKQRKCVDTCATNFQKDYQSVVKSFSKKRGFIK